MYDIIIIGGGPAGLVASIYARRAQKRVLLIEKATFGGQVTYSPKVENIPGFVSLTGNEFAERLVEQAMALDVEVEAAEVIGLRDREDYKIVVTEDGGRYETKTVIIATGARHRLLGLEHEEELIGNGISFCAVCDGAFYADKIVGVVGGGNSALQEALLLSELCRKVYVIQNLDELTGEIALREQIYARENVEVLTGTVVDGLRGDTELRAVLLRNLANDATRTLGLDGLFIAIGLEPQNEPFARLLELDERGYIMADGECRTNVPGVFVAGDCRRKRIRQVTTAAADGTIAALAACDYIDGRV